MPVSRIAVGAPGELSHPDTAKAAVAEFISMLIFVFAGSGSGMAFSEYLNFMSIHCIVNTYVRTNNHHHHQVSSRTVAPPLLPASSPRLWRTP
jgi:hypothetical protein